MFAFLDRPVRLCEGFARRELLRIGGLSAMGLTLPHLLKAGETVQTSISPTDMSFGRAKNIIFLFLAGGPPQHETFDPKPDAPVEVRGPFQPISTNVPGIHFCELLPRTARIADKLAICRSLSTDDNNHDGSGYQVLTGYKYAGPNSRVIQPTDRPYFGSFIKRYRPSEILPPLSTVWIPDMFRLNENVTPAGQTGGFMGSQWDPDRFVGDPSQPGYRVQGIQLDDEALTKLQRRHRLLAGIEHPLEAARQSPSLQLYDGFKRQAFDLLTSGKAQDAFAIHKEPDRVRQRYGMNAWGQTVLLARRLIEAGVRLVHVQWPREPGDNAVDNPLWDTHAQNADRVEDVLCPQFDLGFSALVEDLDQRGLLDETLVVAVGEFGRTPKINRNGGRDHWGHVFSFAMAGAGVRGGQVYGASDRQGGYPIEDRVSAGDFTATLFHLAGLDHQTKFVDAVGREHRVTEGRPLYKLLGTEPATLERVTSTGDVERVPPFDPRITLLHENFSSSDAILPASASSRPKGWRADPLATNSGQPIFGVWQVGDLALLGIRNPVAGDSGGSETIRRSIDIVKGSVALLAQEVRSPFAGTYRLHVTLRASNEEFERWLMDQFQCRLQFFQFTDESKTISNRKELASLAVHPSFQPEAKSFQRFTLEKEFVNHTPGGNFSFGLGLGVAISLERIANGALSLPAVMTALWAIEVQQFQLEFRGKPRNEDVTV